MTKGDIGVFYHYTSRDNYPLSSNPKSLETLRGFKLMSAMRYNGARLTLNIEH